MASFEIPNDDGQHFLKNPDGFPVLWLHTGPSIILDFAAPEGPSGPDLRDVVSPSPHVSVVVFARFKSKLSFSIKANAADALLIVGRDAHGGDAAKLAVFSGDFKNQPGMEIDLLANICRGSDPIKIVKVQHLIYGFDDNIFDQNNTANKNKYGKMMCGLVAKGRAEELFGAVSTLLYDQVYHEPLNVPQVKKRSEVRYKAETITRVRTVIKASLSRGVPARVGVLDSPGSMLVKDHNLIATNVGGHTVVIVGCDTSAMEFLYIDPWGSGSKLKYEGGLTGAPIECPYMGIFIGESNGTRRVDGEDTDDPNILVQKWNSYGTFNSVSGNYLEVVSGPPI